MKIPDRDTADGSDDKGHEKLAQRNSQIVDEGAGRQHNDELLPDTDGVGQQDLADMPIIRRQKPPQADGEEKADLDQPAGELAVFARR